MPEFSIEAMPEVFVSENRLRDEARAAGEPFDPERVRLPERAS